MKRTKILSVIGLLFSSGAASGQECCAPVHCPLPAEVSCGPTPLVEQLVLQEHTVMVPRQTIQRQRVQSAAYQTIQRPRTDTVYEQVAEYINVPTQQTVMVPQVVMQPQTVTTLQPVYRDVPYQYQTQGYETQQVERTHAVTRNVPHDVTYRITTQRVRDVQIPGQPTQRIPLGEPTSRCVTRTEYKAQTTNESRIENVMVPKTMTHTATQRVIDYRPVQQTYHVPVTVNVPQVQTTTQQVLQYRAVPRTVTTMEAVQVPVAVEQDIDVPTIEYVPVRVQSYVPLSSLRR